MIRETIWWHSIDERLPDDGARVLVLLNWAELPGHSVWIGYRYGPRWFYWDDDLVIPPGVTAWADMPTGGRR